MKLVIQLNHTSAPTLIYELPCTFEETHFKDKWLARFYAAKERKDPISEPWAFYNLNNEWSNDWLVSFMNQKIDICNEIKPGLFNRHLTDVTDQQTLNYLHAVFEITHGTLDSWKEDQLLLNNPALRESLSYINQTIHRCESSGDPQSRKIRVVYFDLPKTELYAPEDYDLFTTSMDFGGVYVHYTDVGKPIQELAVANDTDHHAIVPYLHYSADFIIRFCDSDGIAQLNAEEEYKRTNATLLSEFGYEVGDVRLTAGKIKIAQLDFTPDPFNKQNVLNKIAKCNNIANVIIK